MIEKGYKANLETIKLAAKHGDLALVDCQDKTTKKRVVILAAVGRDGEEFVISPLAKMFDGNPYEELNPPALGGEYECV